MSDEITKLYTVAVKGADDGDVAIASSGAIDRDGEIIDPKGWELDNYRAAGLPIQADHNSSIFSTVGNALWAKVSGGKLKFKPAFHEVTQAGRDAKALWDAGIVKTFSVGFLPKEWIDGTEKDGFRRKFTKQELLEISMTPVPSNPEAMREVAKAYHDGIIKDPEFAEYLAPGSTEEKEVDPADNKPIEDHTDEEKSELRRVIDELRERIDNLESRQEQSNVPETEETEIDIEPEPEIEIEDPEITDDAKSALIKAEAAKVAAITIATRKGKVIEID